MSGAWIVGIVVTLVVVLVLLALVLPILNLAREIGGQAEEIDDSLKKSVKNTAGLAGLRTTIDHAHVITAGLARGRARLGG